MLNKRINLAIKSGAKLVTSLGSSYGRKKPKTSSRTGSNLASKAMKLKHKEGISLKEAWKKVKFGYNPPNLVDYEWNSSTKRYNKKCGPSKVRNPSTGRCVSDGQAKRGRVPKPRVQKQIKGYKVEIVIKPIGVDEKVDLKGKNRTHNLKKLVEYYGQPGMLPSLEYVYDIVNTKVTKRIVGDEGRIVFKYNHLIADENEVEVGIDMALSLSDTGRYPITTNGDGRIVDTSPPLDFVVHNLTHMSQKRGAEKKSKPFY
tara:strand:- start:1180 stop:1953 length:774 start_codon:yes stop_codon:yes gene_type:complete